MATKDYAQDGSAVFAYQGNNPSGRTGLITYINDGDNNSFYGAGKTGIDEEGGTYQYTVTLNLRYVEEIKFITEFTGSRGLAPNSFGQGFKLQYYNGSWQTLYEQIYTPFFTEAKTARSYTNGGLGFENVTKIRLWVEWQLSFYYGGAPPGCSSLCYSLILNSAYYPDSGIRFKTNDGLIGIGKDTVAGTHKLRFYDGATVQGIPLLATNSRYATNIRIYDGAAIKALTQVVD